MDRQEFKDVWLPHSDSFYRVAYSILGSESDACDAVQDLYIRLWNSRTELDGIKSPLAYGIRTVRNICIDILRTRNAHAAGSQDRSVEAGMSESLVDGADNILIRKEMILRLKESVSRLPENQKKVFEMRFFRQMDYDEITALTGLSRINVRVLVNRARKAVLRAMGNQYSIL